MALNNFSLLQQKMKEIEKSKKPTEQKSVSKDNLNTNTPSKQSSPSTLKSRPTREKEPVTGKKDVKKDPNIPDRSYGDFYCTICDSHMNSDGMWEAHITGKKHLKNIKKGDTDSNYEDLDVESSVTYEVRNVKDPVLGLSYIHEIRRKEEGVPPLFTCFLCQATITTVHMVIEHVLSMKHRFNFIKENSPDYYNLLEGTKLKKSQLESLVKEVALKLEQKFGRGSVKVKQEKVKPATFPALKRPYDCDDDMPRKLKDRRLEENRSPYKWSKVDNQKRNIKDCRDIINEKRRHTSAYSSEEEDKRTDLHSRQRNYKSPSKTSLDSSRKESCNPRSPLHSFSDKYYSHPRPLSRESIHMDRYGAVPSHSSDSCSYSVNKRQSRAVEALQPENDMRNERTDSSDILRDFIQKVYALPTEIFLKIVLLKLGNIEISGIDELSILTKIINKAQAVFCKRLPPDVQAAIKQMKSQSTDSNVQRAPTVPSFTEASMLSSAANSETSREGLIYIQELINQATVNQNVTSASSSSSSYPYNSV